MFAERTEFKYFQIHFFGLNSITELQSLGNIADIRSFPGTCSN